MTYLHMENSIFGGRYLVHFGHSLFIDAVIATAAMVLWLWLLAAVPGLSLAQIYESLEEHVAKSTESLTSSLA